MNDIYSFKDKCDLALYLIDKVEYYWKRLYLSTMTIVAALLGGAYTNLDSWIIIGVLGVMFFAFTISNLIDHLRVYDYLLLILKDIDKQNYKLKSPTLVDKIKKLPYRNEVILCKISYMAVLIGIVLMTLSLKGII